MQEGHRASRGGLPQASWGTVEQASSGHFCSLQAGRTVLHLNLPIIDGFKS